MQSHFLITSFEIKVSKSKSDLGHFFNNVGLCVDFTIDYYFSSSRSLLFIQLSTCRESGQIMKNQHERNECFDLALALTAPHRSVCVCVKMPDGQIGSNKSQFSL